MAGVLASGLLSACSTGSTGDRRQPEPESTTSVDADAFPVTIEHAFGETTIEEEPKRVATLGWSDQDAALALGVVPVGATKLTWGGNEAARPTGSTPSSRRSAASSRCGTTTPTGPRSRRSPSSTPT